MKIKIFQNKILLALIAANLFVLSFYVVNRLATSYKERREVEESRVKVGARLEEIGLMSKDDYKRLTELRHDAHFRGKVTDENFRWAIEQTKKALASSDPYGCSNRVDFVSPLAEMKNPTSAQKAEMYEMAVALFTVPTANNEVCSGALERIAAANLITATKDARGADYLLPLANHTNPNVRASAQRALRTIGYQVPKATAAVPSGGDLPK